jgi:hypothetical protein
MHALFVAARITFIGASSPPAGPNPAHRKTPRANALQGTTE